MNNNYYLLNIILMKCFNYLYKNLRTNEFTTKLEYAANNNLDIIAIPCSKCQNCKLLKMLAWKNRLLYEYLSLPSSWNTYFVTLTYKPETVAKSEGFFSDYVTEVQNWIKRLRKKWKNNTIKYFVVTENGKKNGRIHHHAIIFSSCSIFPVDRAVRIKRISDILYYTLSYEYSKWANGFCSFSKIEIDLSKKLNAKYAFNYVSSYLTKGAINYQFSRNIGKNFLEKNISSDKKYYIINGVKINNYKMSKYKYKNDKVINNMRRYLKDEKINKIGKIWLNNFQDLKEF